jgi:hypothetical protein
VKEHAGLQPYLERAADAGIGVDVRVQRVRGIARGNEGKEEDEEQQEPHSEAGAGRAAIIACQHAHASPLGTFASLYSSKMQWEMGTW